MANPNFFSSFFLCHKLVITSLANSPRCLTWMKNIYNYIYIDLVDFSTSTCRSLLQNSSKSQTVEYSNVEGGLKKFKWIHHHYSVWPNPTWVTNLNHFITLAAQYTDWVRVLRRLDKFQVLTEIFVDCVSLSSSFCCSSYGSTQQIICLHVTLSLASCSVTLYICISVYRPSLHPWIFCVDSLFSPAWHLHIQHPWSNTLNIPPLPMYHLSLFSLTLSPNFLTWAIPLVVLVLSKKILASSPLTSPARTPVLLLSFCHKSTLTPISIHSTLPAMSSSPLLYSAGCFGWLTPGILTHLPSLPLLLAALLCISITTPKIFQ